MFLGVDKKGQNYHHSVKQKASDLPKSEAFSCVLGSQNRVPHEIPLICLSDYLELFSGTTSRNFLNFGHKARVASNFERKAYSDA